jgi:SAM-dependent methyltransferase
MQDTIVAEGHARGAPVPWWAKIAAKLVLKRLPLSHSLLSRLNIFRHSYTSHNPLAQVLAIKARVEEFRSRTGRLPEVALELGPGEITTCAVVYKALGVAHTILIDVGDFGTTDLAAYERVAKAASDLGLAPPDLSGATDCADVLARCGATYGVNGLADLRRVPDGSVDFISSVAVIEHIRRCEVAATFAELKRIMKGDGLAFHAVDFQDHLGGKLENLRFSPASWESEWMAGSGFYTNRLSASAVIALMREAGFDVEVVSRALWPAPPTTRARIARELREGWTDDDLRVCSVRIVARAA